MTNKIFGKPLNKLSRISGYTAIVLVFIFLILIQTKITGYPSMNIAPIIPSQSNHKQAYTNFNDITNATNSTNFTNDNAGNSEINTSINETANNELSNSTINTELNATINNTAINISLNISQNNTNDLQNTNDTNEIKTNTETNETNEINETGDTNETSNISDTIINAINSETSGTIIDEDVNKELLQKPRIRVILKKKNNVGIILVDSSNVNSVNGNKNAYHDHVLFTRDNTLSEAFNKRKHGSLGISVNSPDIFAQDVSQSTNSMSTNLTNSTLTNVTILNIKRETKDILAVEIDASDLNALKNSNDFSEIILDNPVHSLDINSDANLDTNSDIYNQNAFSITGVTTVKNLGYDGSGQKICVPDTGINYELFNLTPNSTILGYNFVDNNENFTDDNGHGTSIGYLIKSIAPNATLFFPKVIDASGTGYESDVLAGIQYCENNNVSIISLSIGAGMSEGYCDSNIVASEINNAVSKGINVFAATGNDGNKTAIRVPSCASFATRIAASTTNDTIASFSNINNIVDLVAPGEKISTINIQGNPIISSGTSYSAPFVASATALLLQNMEMNNISQDAIRDFIQNISYLMKSTADKIYYDASSNNNSPLNNPLVNNSPLNTSPSISSIGRINILNALFNNATTSPINYTANETNYTDAHYSTQSYGNLYSQDRNTTDKDHWVNIVLTGQPWTNPANAYKNDASRVTNSIASSSETDYLAGSTFAFSIPSNAVIVGINFSIIVHGFNNPAANKIFTSKIYMKKNGAIVGGNRANNIALVVSGGPTIGDKEYSYGGPGDIWNTTWTYSDINNALFGTAITYINTDTSAWTIYLNWIHIIVYYVYPPTISIPIVASPSSNTAGIIINATADQTDPQSLSTITSAKPHSVIGTCQNVSVGPAGGTKYNAVFVCTGTVGLTDTFNIEFTDNNGASINTSTTTATYTNHAPVAQAFNIDRSIIYRKNSTIDVSSAGVSTDVDNDAITNYYRFYNSTGAIIKDDSQGTFRCLDYAWCKTGMAITLSYYSKDIYDATSNMINDSIVIGGQGPMRPSTISDLGGTNGWTTVANAGYSDGVFAVGQFSGAGGSFTNTISVSGFNFTLSDTNKIVGIMMEVQKKEGSATYPVTDKLIQILKAGVAQDNQRSLASWTTNDDLYYYGTSSYLWGTTWNPSDIRDTTFGGYVSAQTNSGSSSIPYIDQIRLLVFDNSPPTVTSQIVDYTTQHAFNITATAKDGDGWDDIASVTPGIINLTSGIVGCQELVNSTDNQVSFTITYKCNGTIAQPVNVNVTFIDSAGNKVNTTVSSRNLPDATPQSPTVSLSPTPNIHVGDQLIATGLSTDPDNDAIIGYYQFTNGTVAIQPGGLAFSQNNTLDCVRSRGCIKGATITARYFGNDTVKSSAIVSASVTVINSNPVIIAGNAVINDTLGHSFTVSANASDVDGGSDIVFSNATVSSGNCINISSAVSDINYSATFRCTGTIGTSTSINVTFIDSNGASAITPTTFNTYPNNPPNATNLTLSTYNISRGIILNAIGNGTDINGDNLTGYYQFAIGSTILQNYSNNSTFDCAMYSSCVKGASLNISFFENDTFSISNILNTNATIRDAALAISLENTFVNFSDSHGFNVTANASDPDGGSDMASVSINYTSGSCANISSVINGNIYSITYACTGTAYAPNKINITFTDLSGQNATTQSSTNTYPNQIPISKFIYYNNISYMKADTLNVSANATDADGDALTYYYQFSNVTTILQNFSAQSTFNCSADLGCRKGRTIIVSFYANDSFSISNTLSNTTTIQNTPPSFISSLSLINFSDSHGFNLSINITDPDGTNDILSTSIITTSGSCTYPINISYGDVSGIIPNMQILSTCTGSGLAQANLKINVTDYSNASVVIYGNNTYPNRKPALIAPVFDNTNYSSSSDVNAYAFVSDKDMDTMNVTFYWYINNILRQTDIVMNVVNGTNVSDTLSSLLTFADDNIYVNVSTVDPSGTENSTTSTHVSVYDSSSPTFINVTQQPSIFQNTSNITMSALLSDEDGVWYAYLETNESGLWKNYSTINITGASSSGFNFSASNPEDVVYANNNLYAIDGLTGIVSEYNFSGNILDSFNVSNQSSTPRGITFLDGKFYVLDMNSSAVYVYNYTGSYTNYNFTVIDHNGSGITYANNAFYITGMQNNLVYVYNVTGGYSGINFTLSNIIPSGITYVPNKFYIVDKNSSRILEYNSTFSLTGANFTAPDNTVTGVAYAKGKLYISGYNTSEIIEYGNISVYGSPLIMNSLPGQYSESSFLWLNQNLSDRTLVGWKIHYYDFSSNSNQTFVKTLKAIFSSNAYLVLDQDLSVTDMTFNPYNATMHVDLVNDAEINISSCMINITLPSGWASNLTGNLINCSTVLANSTFSTTYTLTIPGDILSGALPYQITYDASWHLPNDNIENDSNNLAVDILPNNDVSVVSQNILTNESHGVNEKITSYIITSSGNINSGTISYNESAGNIPSSWIIFSPVSASTSLIAGLSENVSINISVPKGTAPGNYSATISTYVKKLGKLTERNAFNINITVPIDHSWNISTTLVNGTIVGEGSDNVNVGTVTINNIGNVKINITPFINITDGSLNIDPQSVFELENQTSATVTINATIPTTYPSINESYFVKISRSISDFNLIYGFVTITSVPPVIHSVNISTTSPEINGLLHVIANVTDLGTVDTVWYNITVVADSGELNITGILDHTTGDLYETNYTPTISGVYSMTVYANSSGNAISNSSEVIFTPVALASMIVSLDSSSSEITNITYFSGYSLNENLSIIWAPPATAYNVNATWILPLGWNVTNSTLYYGNISSDRNTSFVLSIPSGTLPNTYTVIANVSSQNPDRSFDYRESFISVTVDSNPRISMQHRINASIAHNSSGVTSFYVNATGNADLANVNITCMSGIVCTVFNATFNTNIFNMSVGSNMTLILNATVPLGYPPGNYSGIINASADPSGSVSDYGNVTIVVPVDSSWAIANDVYNISVGKLTSGVIGNVTVFNKGNIDVTYLINSSNSSLINSSTISIFVSRNNQSSFELFYYAPNIVTTNYVNITLSNSSISPQSRNITEIFSVLDFVAFVASPNENDTTTIHAGETFIINANATLDSNYINSGLNWSVVVDGESCSMNNISVASSMFALNCTAPRVPDGINHNITLKATILNLSATTDTTAINALFYPDVTPPNITQTNDYFVAPGTFVAPQITATDNINIFEANATVVSPDGSSVIYSMSQSGDTFTTPGSYDYAIGDYDILYNVSDASGNIANASSFFEIYSPLNLTGSIVDIFGNPISVIIKLYRPSTSRILFNFTAGGYAFTNGEIHDRPYDLEADYNGAKILLVNITFNDSTQNIMQLQSFAEGAINTISLYKELGGVAVATNLTESGSLQINYSGATLIDPARVVMLKCSNWTVVGSVSSCYSDWSVISGTSLNTTLSTIRVNISSFSAYVAAESMCGNGICQLTYGETASTCAIDCLKSSPAQSSSGSGGGRGGAGGFTNGSFVNSSDFEKEINKTKNLIDQIGKPRDIDINYHTIEFDLLPLENSTKTLTITNTKNTIVNVKLSINESIIPFISIDKTSLSIGPSSNSQVSIYALIPNNTKHGAYEGNIIVDYYNSSPNIMSSDNVHVVVKVLDSTNNSISGLVSQRESFSDFLKKNSLQQMALFVVILVLLAMGVGKIYQEVQKKKRYQFKVNSNLLPKKSDRSAWIGLLAEASKEAYIEFDKMQTHTIVAGATGSGKSVAAQVIVEEALKKGIAVVVFDPTAQWSGFLRPNKDQTMLSKYSKYGMNKKDATAFNGNVYQVNSELEIIDINKFMKPGEISIFTLHKLNPNTVDVFVANTVRQIFLSSPQESQKLKCVIVYDEVHRLLPKFGGSGQGFIQIERACREFRKWGIGLVLISQVLSDFVGEIKANIGTQMQMRTADETDLERLRIKYGEEIVKSIVKADTGTGMIENPSYNKGLPYFVNFRPLEHSTARLSDDELEKYNGYNIRLDDINYQIEQLTKEKIDIFELRIELNLVTDKLKQGKFDMVDIYLESIDNVLKRYWTGLKKQPLKREIKLAKIDDIKQSVERAKIERRKAENENQAERIKSAQKIIQKLKLHNIYMVNNYDIDGVLLSVNAVAKKGYKSFIISPKKLESLYPNKEIPDIQYHALTEEIGKNNLSPRKAKTIYDVIANFVANNNNSIMLFDDITSLKEKIGFDGIFSLVTSAKALIAQKNIVIILIISSNMLTAKEIDRLKAMTEYIV